MNERILKLVQQAREYASEYVEDEVEMQFHKKFAELIVRECVGLTDQWPDTVRQVMSRQIKEHFGVEE